MAPQKTQVKHSSGRLPDYVELIEDEAGFAALEEEWEDLHLHCPSATPFQSWAWLYSWWEYYGEGYRLRLITVRDEEGSLVGVLPLMLERGGVLGRLLFVGSGVTDYLDVLVREGWEGHVARAGAGALKQIGSWRVADLQELRPEAAAWDILERWSGYKTSVWQSNCPIIDVKPWEELLSSLSKNRRSTVRRTLRDAQSDGLSRELVGLDESEQSGRKLVALHRIAWQGRGIGPEHLTRRFEDHIATTARRMTARDLGGVSEFRRDDGEVVLSNLLLFGRDFVGAYLQGVSREALKRYQWSSLYIWDGLHIAQNKNSIRFDLLRGEEEYKLRWSSEVVANHRLVLGRDPLIWGIYASYHTLRYKLRDYAHSERAPRWVKGTINKCRALGFALQRRHLRRKSSS